VRSRVVADGSPLPEGPLTVQVVNVARTGPALALVPDGLPGTDASTWRGWEPSCRVAMPTRLDRPDAGPPPLRTARCRAVGIAWIGAEPLLADDEALQRPAPTPVRVGPVLRGVRALLPGAPIRGRTPGDPARTRAAPRPAIVPVTSRACPGPRPPR
jgi:hypothetical protein